MFGGGKKITCPGCGAKNKPGERRCRVCTAIIDASAAEPDQSFMAPGGPATAEQPTQDFAAEPPPAAPAADDGFEGIVIEAAPRNPDSAPPPLLNDEAWDPNWLDEQRD